METQAYERHVSTNSARLNFTNVDADAIEAKNNTFEAALDECDAGEWSETIEVTINE